MEVAKKALEKHIRLDHVGMKPALAPAFLAPTLRNEVDAAQARDFILTKGVPLLFHERFETGSFGDNPKGPATENRPTGTTTAGMRQPPILP